MEQRQRDLRRIAVAIPFHIQARYWQALALCAALAGILAAMLLGAKLLAGQPGPARAAAPLALFTWQYRPVGHHLPGKPARRGPTQRDPLNTRPAELLDLFHLPSSAAIVGGVLAASVSLIVVAPRFYFLGRPLHLPTRATAEGSPNNPRAPPTY